MLTQCIELRKILKFFEKKVLQIGFDYGTMGKLTPAELASLT